MPLFFLHFAGDEVRAVGGEQVAVALVGLGEEYGLESAEVPSRVANVVLDRHGGDAEGWIWTAVVLVVGIMVASWLGGVESTAGPDPGDVEIHW